MCYNSVPETFISSPKIRYFRLGRHALLAALNILQLKTGDGVLVPAFICRDLLASIHAIGAIPYFYEVSQDMKPVELPVIQGVRCVLAVNYFGFPQDLLPFHLYCKINNTRLIEDNAHGYLSADDTGTPLGSRGDLGIFSMRKTYPIPDGAMLLVNNSELLPYIPAQLPYRHTLLKPGFWIKKALSWLQKRTRIPLLSIGKDFAQRFRKFRTGHAIAPLLPESEFELSLEPAPHNYSINSLSNLNPTAEIERRRSLYIKFHLRFASLDIQPVFYSLPVGVSPYGYPFFADGQTSQVAIKIAKMQGLDCIKWPDLPNSITENVPLHYKSLFIVNFTC